MNFDWKTPVKDKVGVLFVCMGNICRSPTAEGVFRVVASRGGWAKKLIIDSAGTHDYHVGEPPDARAIDGGVTTFGSFVRAKSMQRTLPTSIGFWRWITTICIG